MGSREHEAALFGSRTFPDLSASAVAAAVAATTQLLPSVLQDLLEGISCFLSVTSVRLMICRVNFLGGSGRRPNECFNFEKTCVKCWCFPPGGFISFNGSWRVQGILAMSRSLGDYPLKNLNVVIPDPDILTFDLDKLQPEFMILASDGLWDAFSNEEAVRFIKERLDEPHFGAKSIVLQSFYRGCPDNITVMVVKFRNSSKTEEQ